MRIMFLVAALLLTTLQAAHAQRLHAFLVADTAMGGALADSVERDIRNLRSVLEVGLPRGRLQIIQLTGPDVTPNSITTRLRNLPINPEDAVVLFYSGHGGYDPNRGHFLALTRGGRLDRSEVVSAITQPVTPRFWGVITDCCASIPPVAVAPVFMPGDQTTLLTHLFLETSGKVDITSSRPEQISLGLPPPIGGVFTWSLCGVLKDHASERLNWNEVFQLTRAETAEFAERFLGQDQNPHRHNGIPQRTQIPYSFRPMYGREVNGLRLGMTSQNLVVISVDDQSPAARAGLRPGVRVLRVNGLPMTSDQQIATAVNFSSRDVTLEIERNGRVESVRIRLAY